MKQQKQDKAMRVLLIVLTALIIAPMLFIGSCLPIGTLSFYNYPHSSDFSNYLFLASWIIGFAVTGYFVYKIIRRINDKKKPKFTFFRLLLVFLFLILVWLVSSFILGFSSEDTYLFITFFILFILALFILKKIIDY